MTRYFLACFALTACLLCLPGCGSGDAEFKPTEAPSADEEATAQEYTEALSQQAQDEAMKSGKDPFPLNN